MENTRDLTDLMIALIRNGNLSIRTARMAADVIGADARFNVRVGKVKEQKPPDSQMLALIDFAEDVLSECRSLVAELDRGTQDEIVYQRLSEIYRKLNQAAK